MRLGASFVGYNRWANEKISAASRELSDADLRRENTGVSFSSIFETLDHILAAQHIWLGRWKGTPRTRVVSNDLNDLAARLNESHSELEEFVGTLSDEDWVKVIDYVDSEATPHRRRLGDLITHLVNHGTHHRSEAAALLTAAGHSPGDLDYLYFLPEEAS